MCWRLGVPNYAGDFYNVWVDVCQIVQFIKLFGNIVSCAYCGGWVPIRIVECAYYEIDLCLL